MLEDHETPTTDNQRLIISVLFTRAHQSFQAAITLVEKGMLADARIVLCSAVEGAKALNVLANDATFDMQLIEAHLHNQRKTARIVLNTPEYRSGYAAAEIAQMETTIKDVTDKEAAAGREFRDITWATAPRCCLSGSEFIRRQRRLLSPRSSSPCRKTVTPSSGVGCQPLTVEGGARLDPTMLALCSPREALVRHQHQILYRHGRSRMRDHTGQLTSRIGQANQPLPAAAFVTETSQTAGSL